MIESELLASLRGKNVNFKLVSIYIHLYSINPIKMDSKVMGSSKCFCPI